MQPAPIVPRSHELSTPTAIGLGMLAVPVALLAIVIFTGGRDRPGATPLTGLPPPASTPAAPAAPEPLLARLMAQIPDGDAGAAIRRGRELVEHTYELRPANVGNGLHCTSCHLDGGTLANAGPWIGLPAVFPEFRARSGKVDALSRRVNDCFERSMNGTALDPDGEDMAAILGYMTFISRAAPDGRPPPGRGFPRITPPPAPDRQAGADKYATRCASCHGADGAGLLANGTYAFPAVWGPRSFNIGAGMARLDTAAAFIRANMPRGAGGTLSAQDAYDIADFMIIQPRPDFAGKVNDWPQGGKPRDARY